MIPPHKEDRITPKLPALHFYQLSLPVPKPPSGAFDVAATGRGEALFNGKARLRHVPRSAAIYGTWLELAQS